jgi:small subunit ribosomal protein S9
MIEDERQDEGQEPEEQQPPEAEQPEPEQPEAEQPEPEQPEAEQPEPEQPEAEQPEPEQPEAEQPEEAAPEAEEPQAEEPEASEEPSEPRAQSPEPEAEAEERPKRERKREKSSDEKKEEVIPGLHLEPDLVLEEERAEDEYSEYAAPEDAEEETAPGEEPEEAAPAGEPEAVAREPLDLAADARYGATGKRKTAVARVILKPGDGTYQINGRHLDEFFPRIKLQRMARQPLEVAGYGSRMDVSARIHGGGVAAQAGALRHGIARALVEADPNLRVELKRRGYLTRDPRVKERKKAGLKKARKRPQFSKR